MIAHAPLTAFYTVDFGKGGATVPVPVDGAAKRVAAIGFGNGLLRPRRRALTGAGARG